MFSLWTLWKTSISEASRDVLKYLVWSKTRICPVSCHRGRKWTRKYSCLRIWNQKVPPDLTRYLQTFVFFVIFGDRLAKCREATDALGRYPLLCLLIRPLLVGFVLIWRRGFLHFTTNTNRSLFASVSLRVSVTWLQTLSLVPESWPHFKATLKD